MTGIHVLIAEDEIPSQFLMKNLVRSRAELAYADVIEDGHETLNKIMSNNYDLVLLDINLPGLSGIEVLEKLKENRKMPYVIFTTAYSEYAIKAFDYNAVDFLLKPISSERFNQAIDKFLVHYENNIKLYKSKENIKQRNITYDIIFETIRNNLQLQEEKKKYADKTDLKRKILLVNDDKANLQVLKKYLDNEKYSIDVAVDDMEALDKINAGNYDLVLLDIKMPKISYFEMCEKIRQNFRKDELPIIMLTTKDNASNITIGFKVGANDYIVKPFDKEALSLRINTLISLKESAEQINDLKKNIETIISNIPEGILLLSPELEITYFNNRIKELFGIQESDKKNIKKLFDKVIYKNIYNFSKKKKDKLIFEWIIGKPENPVLVSIILKFINEKFILIVMSEIKNVLAEKELETCFYIIRGFSERETAKLLHKGRTTVNSNKTRAMEKLKKCNYSTLLNRIKS